MPDYTKGKIYTIRCRTDDKLIYVGSTIERLSARFAKHKCNKKVSLYKFINNPENNTSWEDWYIELYELYPCGSKEELCKRENEVIREIATINKYGAYLDKKEYNKEYWAENKDKIKEYRAENRDTISAQRKEHYVENKDKLLAQMKEYYAENKDKHLAQMKEYYTENKDKLLAQMKEYKAENRDKLLAKQKEYYAENRDKLLAQMKEYRAKKKAEKGNGSTFYYIRIL
jgi:hypothetical protein